MKRKDDKKLLEIRHRLLIAKQELEKSKEILDSVDNSELYNLALNYQIYNAENSIWLLNNSLGIDNGDKKMIGIKYL